MCNTCCGQLIGVHSFLPPCGSRGLNFNCQTLGQAPLHPEPACPVQGGATLKRILLDEEGLRVKYRTAEQPKPPKPAAIPRGTEHPKAMVAQRPTAIGQWQGIALL